MISRSILAIRDWLVHEVSERLNIPHELVDVRRPFRDYGLDSIGATRLIADLGLELGKKLPATLAWEHPNVQALAEWLAGETAITGQPTRLNAGQSIPANEPIALVGLSCRFPKGSNASEFWRSLCDGVDAISDVPSDRWDAEAYYDPEPASAGKIVTRRGGFLDRVDQFDAGFFGISPREAAFMDPQQRLMLELGWESLEDAGVPPLSLRESRTGVFFGVVWRDYAELQAMDSVDPSPHTATGHSGSIIANRVSYVLGLQGPSIVVDTACSSSLVAVHQACQSLRSGESHLALAGGVMLLLSPRTSVGVSAFGGLSPDGQCKTFDAAANGYVRGEGAGIVVLKRLSDALSDGDSIYCLIRGSAVNNDGATNGLTAPSVAAQQSVLMDAYTSAGIDPSTVSYIELHGTGTALGDPIEARALGAVLGNGRESQRPLLTGSVKTNIGHLEGAAGIAGLIKLALSLRHGLIPPSLHFHQANPHIDFDQLRLRVVTEAMPWPESAEPRRAGVSSFGFGGTNCHVVVEELRSRPVPKSEATSAVATSRDTSRPKLAFIFSGAGPVWHGMGRELFAAELVFRAKLAECDTILRGLVDWSLIEELLAEPDRSRFHLAEVHLPLMFSMQVALAALWESHGIRPHAVVGYSIGEWAAAHIAGAITLEDGLRLACGYAQALKPVSRSAGMAIVGLPAQKAAALIAPYEGRLAISADNGGGSTGVGGERTALEKLTGELQGIFFRILEIDCYAHIPHVEPLTPVLRSACSGIASKPLGIPMVSTVSGTWVRDGELDAEYWVRNFREPVAFVSAVKALAGAGCSLFVEIAPHPAHGRDIALVMEGHNREAETLPSIQRGSGERTTFAGSLERLRNRGFDVLGGGFDAAAPETTEILVLSAHTDPALRQSAGAMAGLLEKSEPSALRNVCYTAAVRRSHLDHRLAVTGNSAVGLSRKLADFSEGESITGAAQGHFRSNTIPKIAFVFSGQGTVWAGVAQTLIRDEPAFRDVIEQCHRYIWKHGGWSLLDELAEPKESSRMEETEIAQPLQFAIQVGLSELWRHWGITPDGVVGHSVGEYAAAYTAGIIGLEDALRAVCARGRLMQQAKGLGGMASVAAAAGAVATLLESPEHDVWISAVNSPTTTVVSGDDTALANFLDPLHHSGITSQRLPVKYAFHSPQMDAFRPRLVEELETVEFRSASLPFYSTVSGLRQSVVDAEYWGRNMRDPVLFAEAIDGMAADGFNVFIEISAHRVLQGAIADTLVHSGRKAIVVPSLRSGAEERSSLLESVGALYAAGVPIAWDRLFPDGGQVVPLVPYPWQRERAWIPTQGSVHKGLGVRVEKGHPLLGNRLRALGQAAEFECQISGRNAGPLGDHLVYGTLVVPGASHLARLITAVDLVFGRDKFALRDIAFPEALAIGGEESRTVHVVLGDESNGNSCQIASLVSDVWTTHASGRVDFESSGSPEPVDLAALQRRSTQAMAGTQLYDGLWEQGLHLGEHYRWVDTLWRREREVLCRMRQAVHADAEDGGLIPGGLIDSCFQLLGAAESFDHQDGVAFVPISVDSVRWFERPAGPLWCHLVHRAGSGAGGTATADLKLFHEDGTVLLEIEGLTVKRAPRELFLRDRGLYHEIAWETAGEDVSGAALQGSWLIAGDPDGIGEALASRLSESGAQATVIAQGDELDRETLVESQFHNVVYLQAMTVPAPDAERTLEEGQRQACGTLVRLVQAIAQARTDTPPRLWLVTRGAQQTSSQDPTPRIEQAPIWGLGQALAEEHPEFRCVCVDLDPAGDAVQTVLLELATQGHADRIAWRAGKRLTPRLAAKSNLASGEAAVDSNAAYLVSGGMGGLGIRVAGWLVERGARHITLMGRGEPSGEVTQSIRDSERTGAQITIARGDVQKRADVTRVLDEIRATGRPLKGIIHAAGVLDDGVLLDQTWPRFWNVMGSKVDGAWNLHTLTKDCLLDWFVLFSSAASILRAPGQSNYAAANAFLDSLAQYRRSLGLPGTSINWGPWADAGMAARTGTERMRSWNKRGLEQFSASEGLGALSRILASGLTNVAVLRLAKAAPDRASREQNAQPAKSDLRSQILNAPTQQRRELMERHLEKRAAAILGMDEEKPIDPARPLRDIGFDSLMAVEFRNLLAKSLGRSLPATLLFDYPTLAKLGEYLLEEFSAAVPAAAVKAAKGVRTQALPDLPEDAIAIMGMACRFPGGANTPERYWQNLRDGIDAISEVPRKRWDLDAFFDANPNAAGKMYSRWGGFLDNVDQFDPGFFGIAPREARGMDPQQRILLEVASEALERAGVPAGQLSGTQTGVFLGFCLSDYAQLQLYNNDPSGIDAYSGTGSVGSVAAGRLSYVFGLQGPCLAVDTACSSSLVSVHLACQSIRKGECDVALAGGVNLLLSPNISVYFSRLTALSPDGRCKAFDASANGYVRGEGCGLIVLKRLSRAMADGDRILAVVRGSAVNQDGRSNGLTAPNGKAQEQVLRQAAADAKVNSEDISYIEAHGTGTQLGDPIEVGALGTVLGAGRTPDNKLWLGSVKTNIGHLEGAAGIAGLMKLVLMLEHKEIPPSLHLHQPNPYIPWDDLPIEVPTALQPWEVADRPRIAGVSSFGFSGTNAHIVLQEAPSTGAPVAINDTRPHVFALSAKSPAALESLVKATASSLEANAANASHLGDLCYTSTVRRTHHEYRMAIAVRSMDALRDGLRNHVAGETTPGLSVNHVTAGSRPKLAFVFSGHGSQWFGMGRELLDDEPVFRESIEKCAAALERQVDWSLLDQLRGNPSQSRLSESDVAQPVIFAVQVSLAALWRSWGIEPAAVVGHSSGEIAAAHVAGVLTLDEAARIVCSRTKLVKAAAGHGAMLAADVAPDKVSTLLNGDDRRLWIAAVNSPNSVVLSGEIPAVAEFGAKLEAAGIYCRRVDVDYASHCPLMDPFRDQLTRSLRGLRARKPLIPIYSTVSGRLAAEEDFSAEYWSRHLRQPVRFREAIDELLSAGYNLFLCADPHPVLAQPLTQCIESRAKSAAVIASLRRNQDQALTLQTELGKLHTLGYPIDWNRQFPDAQQIADLPAYPWQHERYWVDAAPVRRAESARQQGHPLLGRKIRTPLSTVLFESHLNVESLPLLSDHKAYGKTVVAGACHLAMALCAAREVTGRDALTIDNAAFPEALVLSDEPTTVQLALTPRSGGSHAFEIQSLHDEDWRLHASGAVKLTTDPAARTSLDALRQKVWLELSSGSFYEGLAKQGVDYGHAFRWIDRLWQGPEEAMCTLRAPEGEQATGAFVMHPGLIDSWFQLLRAVPVLHSDTGDPVVPVAVDSLRLYSVPEGPLWAHAAWKTAPDNDPNTFTADLLLFNEAGGCIAEARGLTAKRAPRDLFLRGAEIQDWLYRVDWSPADFQHGGPLASRSYLILSDRAGAGLAIAERLRASGAYCRVIGPDELQSGDGWARVVAEPADSILYLRALDAGSQPGRTMEAEQRAICGGILELTRALARTASSESRQLWLVTRGAQPVGPVDPAGVLQASLWGLGLTLREELAELRCTKVDIENGAAGIEDLIQELMHGGDDDRVAWRDGRRYAARLVRSEPAPAKQLSLHGDATYLVTGGLGGLGLKVSEWMVRSGARNILLCGRQGPTAAAEESIRRMEQAGARITIERADVTRRADLERIVSQIRAGAAPLRGVVHAAGVLDDGVLEQLTWERMYGVIGPKAGGAWNLHEVTSGDKLDFFVLFSSATSIIGSAGQGNHAAGNAFLDALAHYRRGLGLPALSINWGPWSEIGQAAEEHRGGRLAKLGIGSIAPDRGIEVLSLLLRQDTTQALVLAVDWHRWRQTAPDSSSRFLSELATVKENGTTNDPAAQDVSAETILQAAPESRAAMLMDALRREVSSVLQLPAAGLESERVLIQYGLDSLMALELRRRIDRKWNVSVPLAKLLGGLTLSGLSESVLTEIEKRTPVAGDPEASSDEWMEIEL